MDKAAIYASALDLVDDLFAIALHTDGKVVGPRFTTSPDERTHAARQVMNRLLLVAPAPIVQTFCKCAGLGDGVLRALDIAALRELMRLDLGILGGPCYVSPDKIWHGRL